MRRCDASMTFLGFAQQLWDVVILGALALNSDSS